MTAENHEDEFRLDLILSKRVIYINFSLVPAVAAEVPRLKKILP